MITFWHWVACLMIPYLVVAFEAILTLMVPTKRGFFYWEPALAYTVVTMLAPSPATDLGASFVASLLVISYAC